MKLLNQIRDDAGRLSNLAIPEAVTAVDQLLSGDSLAKVVVALVARLEQDIPGLVHPETTTLPDPLITPVQTKSEPAVADRVHVREDIGGIPTQSREEVLEKELSAERARVASLQSAATPDPQSPPHIEGQGQGA